MWMLMAQAFATPNVIPRAAARFRIPFAASFGSSAYNTHVNLQRKPAYVVSDEEQVRPNVAAN